MALVLAVAVCMTAITLTFVRWYILVRAQELPFTLARRVAPGLIGNALNVLLPGSIGGDIVKATCIAREQSRRTVAVATVLIDRAIGLWRCSGSWRFWAGPSGLGWLHGNTEATLHTIILGAAGLVAGTVLVWLLLGVLPRRRAERLCPPAGRHPENRALGGRVLGGHLDVSPQERQHRPRPRHQPGRARRLHVHVLPGRATIDEADQIPTVAEHFLIVPIGGLAEACCPTPNGIGGGEAAYFGLYELMGKHGDYGLMACLVKRGIYWLPALLGYLVYLRMRSETRARARVQRSAEPAPIPTAVVPRPAALVSRALSSDLRPPASDR